MTALLLCGQAVADSICGDGWEFIKDHVHPDDSGCRRTDWVPPTQSPTATPTKYPTTAYPTKAPTLKPTPIMTWSPTPAPTAPPTRTAHPTPAETWSLGPGLKGHDGAHSLAHSGMYSDLAPGQVPAGWKGNEAQYHALFDKNAHPDIDGYNYNLHGQRLRRERRKAARWAHLHGHMPTPPPTPVPDKDKGVIGVDPVASNSLFDSLFTQQKADPKASDSQTVMRQGGRITCPHITCKYKQLKSGRQVVLVKTHHSNDAHKYHHHCAGSKSILPGMPNSCNCACWDK